MDQPLNVLVVHGIGEQSEAFAAEFDAQLSAEVRRRVGELAQRYRLSVPRGSARLLNVIPGLWAPVPEGLLKELERRLFGGRVDRLRALAIRFMGDVIAYQGAAAYQAIHRTLTDALRKGLVPASRHLTVVAHSLGSVIASDWLFDHTQRSGTRLREHFGVDFVNFFTLGSPLALYAARSAVLEPEHADPPRMVNAFCEPVRVEAPRGVWVNIYSDDDVVGCPLKPVNAAYHEAVTADVVMDAGNFLTRWNLLSHGAYWSEASVIAVIGEKLAIDYASGRLGLAGEALDEACAEYLRRAAPIGPPRG